MKISIGFFLLGLCSSIAAHELSPAYREGSEVGKAHANQSIDVLKALDLTEFPGYQGSLSQENYYGGVTQESTRLEADSQQASQNSEAGKSVMESFNHRPLYKVNPASESMQKLNQIAENADAIMHGQTTDKTTCTLKPKECHYAWEEKTCVSGKILGKLHCARHLRIDVSPYKTENYNLEIRQSGNKRPFRVTVNLAVPNTCKSSSQSCYTMTKDTVAIPAIVLPANCASIKVGIVDAAGLVTVEQSASCANPSLSLIVGKCKGRRCSVPYYHSVSMSVEIEERKEYWDNQCQHLQHQEKEGFCHLLSPLTCTVPSQTKMIGDVPITRACWKEEATYQCGGEEKGTCDEFIARGCEQTDSICLNDTNGRCTRYQQTYQCPLNQCSDNALICGGDAFCLDGDCSAQNYAPSNDEDFKKGIASLAAATDASKDFDSKANFVFNGQMLECSREIAGVKNCCRESGWGIDLNLAHCNDKEKKLGKARENGLTIPTGEYCAKRQQLPIGSVCVDHHKTYCVFQSKLARIIQAQGRFGQLHIGFGEGEHSNCSGITPAQLQLIKFEAINFSEFYADIQSRQRNPDTQQTTNQISSRFADFYQQGDANG